MITLLLLSIVSLSIGMLFNDKILNSRIVNRLSKLI